MRELSVAAVLLAGATWLAGCGGGGGGGDGPGVPLTADPRGTTLRGLDPLEGAGAAAPSDAAEGMAGDLAREIEQADVYRVDGDRLVLLNAHRGLTVVDLAAVEVVSRTAIGGFPHDLFLRGDRALALHDGPSGLARLTVVSLADAAAPVVEGVHDLAGPFVAGRLVGDVLYVVADGEAASFHLGPVVARVDDVALPNGASSVHAAPGLLVVAGWWDGLGTPVDLVDASDPGGALARRGGVVAPGFVADEWKLDVAGAVLRVVAHDATDGGLSRLVTYDVSDLDAPVPLGSLELARGEQLFATRFSGDVAYLVTFERVDPLWVVDLTDPAAPAIAGELVVPGWSTHLVPVGTRLVAAGVDPAQGFQVTVSLFDVSDPGAPALLDREDFGAGWSEAFSDPRALGVFEAEGLVTLPVSGDGSRVAVLSLGAASLDLRGAIDVEGTALRGFPHGPELVALSTEEVVVADAATLAVRARATLAENVVDAMRLSDGSVATLVARRADGALGGLDLPLVPSALFPRGDRAAVVGWDDAGACAYVADLSGPTPALSARFALGTPAWGKDGVLPMIAPDGGVFGYPPQALLSAGGRLVVRGLPGVDPFDGEDGFVVIDVDAGVAETPLSMGTGVASGFALDGERLAVTLGDPASPDGAGRPRMSHALVLVDLVTRAATPPSPVRGWVVAAHGGRVFLVDEQWQEDWTWTSTVVAVEPDAGGAAPETDALRLPDAAYDLRAAGATLFVTTMDFGGGGGIVVGTGPGGGGGASPPSGSGAAEWTPPRTEVATVRLGALLAFGPSIEATGFASLLLPQDGAALLVRDGLRLERWDVSGFAATLELSAETSGYPLRAREDGDPHAYLIALGYGGVLELP